MLAFRRHYFTAYIDAGFLRVAPGSDPGDGIYDDVMPPVDPGLSYKVTAEIVCWAEYNTTLERVFLTLLPKTRRA